MKTLFIGSDARGHIDFEMETVPVVIQSIVILIHTQQLLEAWKQQSWETAWTGR